MTRCAPVALVALVGVAAGSLLAPSAQALTSQGTPLGTPDRASWLAGSDLAWFDMAIDPDRPDRYVEIPGEMEFRGFVLVRPSDANAGPGSVQLRSVSRDRALDRLDGLIVRSDAEIDQHVVRVPAGVSDADFAEFLELTGDYQYAHPDWLVYPIGTPDDRRFDDQWHHQNMQSVEAWNISTGSDAVVIAICDTGVDTDHPDLQAALVSGYNSVDDLSEAAGGDIEDINNHGTHVAGCAAAIGNNDRGVVGVGWNFRIMPVRVSNSTSGGAAMSDIQRGARWSVENGARIANASYSGVRVVSNQITAEYITGLDGQFFWAAGNSGGSAGDFIHPDLAVVAATDENDDLAGFSSFGRGVDFAAPGVRILATERGGGYVRYSGTSMATPVAAGLAGLLWSIDPLLTPAELRRALELTADPFPATSRDVDAGSGRINAFAAAQFVDPTLGLPLPFAQDFSDPFLSFFDWSEIVGVDPAFGFGPPSAPFVVRLGPAAELATFRLAFDDATGPVTASFWHSTTGTEAGDDLVVELYDRPSNTWSEVGRIEATGSAQLDYTQSTFALPDAAIGGKVRLRTLGSDTDDMWMVDDLHIAEAASCPADISSAAAPGVADGVLTGADFFEFLARFQAGDLRADLSSATIPGTPDGELTGADFFEFLDLFSSGCP